ncbi:enoyl-[acyl-carrier-protein] reductase [NADH], chloroplastic-like protein [Tanacetum coccineum]
MTTKAISDSSYTTVLPGLRVDLRGKKAFIAGIADDNGYGWAIAKSLAAAGAEILVGTWVPALNIFETSLRRGKFDESRVLPDGSLMNITKVYPLDAVYDTPEDVPQHVISNKRYVGSSKWTIKEVTESVKEDFGSIDILVHSLANGPEVTKPLLETSRHDGHPGPYRNLDPKKITKRSADGRPPPQDCLHWCMPGPVDTWNEFLMETIRRDFESQDT